MFLFSHRLNFLRSINHPSSKLCLWPSVEQIFPSFSRGLAPFDECFWKVEGRNFEVVGGKSATNSTQQLYVGTCSEPSSGKGGWRRHSKHEPDTVLVFRECRRFLKEQMTKWMMKECKVRVNNTFYSNFSPSFNWINTVQRGGRRIYIFPELKSDGSSS